MGRLATRAAEDYSWLIWVNGEWKCLGDELSTLLECAHKLKHPKLTLFNYLDFDLVSMTTIAPLYAPLKRIVKPAMALHCLVTGMLM